MNTIDKSNIPYGLGVVAGAVSVSINDLNTMLGLILTGICIVSMVLTTIFKIVAYVKDGKLSQEEIDDLTKSVNQITDTVSKIKGEKEDDKD